LGTYLALIGGGDFSLECEEVHASVLADLAGFSRRRGLYMRNAKGKGYPPALFVREVSDERPAVRGSLGGTWLARGITAQLRACWE
jgi:hypothetical protein